MQAANVSAAPPPWHRQLWPWLLMIAPATAFFGGIFTFWLAATSNNALVVDDYYKEGRAINRELARDRHATDLGLHARLGGTDGVVVELRSDARQPLPDRIRLQLVHPTRAELDRVTELPRVAEGVYARRDIALPAPGRWTVEIGDVARSWRLTGTASGFAAPFTLDADAR